MSDTASSTPSIAVLPLGATEQHGPHLPFETDTIIAETIANAARLKLAGTDMAVEFLPAEPVGYSVEHSDVSGTRTLAFDEAVSRWIRIGEACNARGIRKFVMLNAHGGNSPLMTVVATELRVRFAMLAVATSWTRFALPHGLVPAGEKAFGIHGGEIETSVMLAARPDLIEKVRPDFPFFAKRPILDCGYYDTLLRDDVDLVQGELKNCEEDAIVLSDGTRIECDALVLATGYTLEYFSDFDIAGRDGVVLQDLWNPIPHAYKGMEVPGFPNFFITAGPNSALASSHTVLAEQQVHYVVKCLKRMVEDDLATMEVTQQACDAFNDMLQERMENTIWIQSGSAHGYYRHHTGKIVLAFPGPNVEYWKMLRRPEMSDYAVEPNAG